MSFQPLNPVVGLGFSHGITYIGPEPIVEAEVAAVDSDGVLLGQAKRMSFIVDSGADYTIIDQRWAGDLGLDLARLPEADISGIGQIQVPSRAYMNMQIGLCGIWVTATVVFQPNTDVGLLGRDGVFEYINFAFVHGQRQLFAAA